LGAAAHKSGKAIIFRTNAKFFGQKPAGKNLKNVIFVFIKQKIGIHSIQRYEAPEIPDYYQ